MKQSLRACLTWIFALFMAGVTVRSYVVGSMRESSRETLRVGLEDVAARMRQSAENLKQLESLSAANALAKARALSRLIKADPRLLTDQARFAALRETLDVDELHVSDEKGVLIRSVPPESIGFDLHSSIQSRPFTEAITNKSFALVQEPMAKGLDGTSFQFAGVARLDRPGVVQVGYRAIRVANARKLSDISGESGLLRIGRNGRVTIEPVNGRPPVSPDFHIDKDADGNGYVSLSVDCAGSRITVRAPEDSSFLAEKHTYEYLVVIDLLLLLLVLSIGSSVQELLWRDFRSLRSMFANTSRQEKGWSHFLRSPIVLVGGLTFVVAVGLSWLVSAHSARRSAEEILLSASRDMHDTVGDCVDESLFYQGHAITGHYKSPEKMTVDTVQEIMHRYDIDELNIVNEKGIIVAGALADVGYDMGSSPLSAEFNCLLNGRKTYSQAFRGAIENPSFRRKYVGVAFPPPAKGYVQMGFDESRVRDGIDYWFESAASGWHIGETGFFIIAKDETGRIDSCGLMDAKTGKPVFRHGDTLAGIGFDATRAPKSDREFFTAELYGIECLCLSEVYCYHRIITAFPLAEISGGSHRVLIMTALVLLLVFVLVTVFMTRLSDLVSQLKGFIAADRRRQLKDLTLAKTIQTSSLPVHFPDEPDYEIFARMDTAREVGGDFYDFYTLSNGKVLFLVADVSGKGVPAALFMMRAKAIVRNAVFDNPDDLSRAVAAANDALAEQNDAEMFVTAWIGIYDRTTGEVVFVNAGHNPPLIKRADGNVEWVHARGGLVLAAAEGVRYRTASLRLNPGDSLCLYTDGVTEAMNELNELYGEARLERVLRAASRKYVDDIRADMGTFVGKAEQSDDITLLALDIKPKTV